MEMNIVKTAFSADNKNPLQLYGCIIVLLTEEKDFVEYRVPKDIINKIIEMDMDFYLK